MLNSKLNKKQKIVGHILKSLAKFGPMTPYRVADKLKENGQGIKARNAIYNRFPQLEEEEPSLVYVFKETKYRARDRERSHKIYSITPYALSYCLSPHSWLSKWMWNQISDIAENNPHLSSLLFAMWKKYKRADLLPAILKILENTSPLQITEIFRYTRADMDNKQRLQLELERIDSWFVLVALTHMSDDDYFKLITVLKQEPVAFKQFFDMVERLSFFSLNSWLRLLERFIKSCELIENDAREKYQSNISNLPRFLEDKISKLLNVQNK